MKQTDGETPRPRNSVCNVANFLSFVILEKGDCSTSILKNFRLFSSQYEGNSVETSRNLVGYGSFTVETELTTQNKRVIEVFCMNTKAEQLGPH